MRVARLLVLCASGAACHGPGVGVGPDASAEAAPRVTDVRVVANPNCVLSATLFFTTDRPSVGEAHVANTGGSGDAAFADNAFSTPMEPVPVTSHALRLIGMRALSSFAISFTATDAEGRTSTGTASFETPALSAILPPFEVVTNDKAQTAPGYEVFDVEESTGQPVSDLGGPGSALIAVDSDLQVVWYQLGVYEDPHKLPSGNFVALTGKQTSLWSGWAELDMMGEVVAEHPISAEQVPTFSHAITPETDAGPLVSNDVLSLSTVLRPVSGYGADGGLTYNVVGSLIVEMALDGGTATVLSDTFDFFNPHYEGPNQASVNDFQANFWGTVYPDAGATKDWIHANAVSPDPSDGTIISSSRTLSWIYKVTRDGELVWKLGPNGDFTLTNPGETFQYAQHGAYVTDTGTLMCFDDGNGRPLAAGQAPFSRALEYSLDTATMQATIVWQFRDGFNASGLGSSYVLPGGTVLVDDGCNLVDATGSSGDPANLKTARVFEVTHTTPPVVLSEVDFDTPIGAFPPDPLYSGFAVYRAYKWPSLY